MITLKEALMKAKNFRNSEISGIRDCKDRWIFAYKEDNDKMGVAPVVVFKSNGNCGFFSVTEDNVDILLNGTNIEFQNEIIT